MTHPKKRRKLDYAPALCQYVLAVLYRRRVVQLLGHAWEVIPIN